MPNHYTGQGIYKIDLQGNVKQIYEGESLQLWLTEDKIYFVKQNGFSVVREFQGHGIGKEMHEDPGIPNYGKAGKGIRLEPGMTLAIEPMVIMGKPDILVLDDGWTIVTEDGSLSAHYENTILVTEKEPEILTLV